MNMQWEQKERSAADLDHQQIWISIITMVERFAERLVEVVQLTLLCFCAGTIFGADTSADTDKGRQDGVQPREE